ncbi:MAG: creatininase family protein [Anaerolineae bacterium]
MTEVRMEYLRPGQLRAEQQRVPVVFLPTGLLEWHGPHLPLGVDMLLAHQAAVSLARRVGGVVHPALFCGTERERPAAMLRDIGFRGDEWIVGMDFPANIVPSLYYPEEFVGLAVRETLTLLNRLDYRLIVIVNGHGASNQITTLQRLAAAFTAQGPARVMLVMPFPIEHDEQGVETTSAGHADAFETAAMLASYPQTVSLDSLPPAGEPLHNADWAIVDGPTFSGNPTPDHTVRPANDPRRAQAATAVAAMDAVIERVSAEVAAVLAALTSGTGA